MELLPVVMSHPYPADVWDQWENEKYKDEIALASAEWCRIVSRVLREEKLKQKRLKNPTYCNKSRT